MIVNCTKPKYFSGISWAWGPLIHGGQRGDRGGGVWHVRWSDMINVKDDRVILGVQHSYCIINNFNALKTFNKSKWNIYNFPKETPRPMLSGFIWIIMLGFVHSHNFRLSEEQKPQWPSTRHWDNCGLTFDHFLRRWTNNKHNSRHETFNQCCFNVGPPSTTLAQH